jgi:tetratricopeptide (TPR) repeat protein
VLAQLQEVLAGQGRAALSGLGGVGKTQTAVEYAHRHLEEYDYIFWVSAASREGLLSGYMTIAGLLKLPESDAQDQMLTVDAVLRWLSSHERWLLILDNADDLTLAHTFIPPAKNGHVLLTTQAGAVGPVARRVEIQEMGTQEGALFLLRRATCIGRYWRRPPKMIGRGPKRLQRNSVVSRSLWTQSAKAEPVYRRVLAIREKALGSEHPDVAQSLNHLAGLYATRGQYEKAEPLFQRAVGILGWALGPKHPIVETCLNNYGRLLLNMDRSKEVEALESRPRATRAKKPRPNEPCPCGSGKKYKKCCGV